MPFDPSGAYVITLDEKTHVSCHVEMVGTAGKYPEFIRRRWIFQTVIDGERVRSVGPFYTPIDHEDQLRELVTEWLRFVGR